MAKLKRGRSMEDDDVGPEAHEIDVPKNKKAKNAQVSKESLLASNSKNDKGEPYWELSSFTRRVTITKFGYGKSKETIRVDIREFYDKEGEYLPGKKGISLSVEQFNALLRAIPSITAVLVKEGETVEGIGGESVDNGSEPIASKPKKLKPKPARSNIEATSDEDEE